MNKKSRKLLGTTLAGVMSVGAISGAINTAQINGVEASTSKNVQAVHAKIEHIIYSLKANYLGLKNVGTWQQYIKEAKELNAKLPSGSSKDKYAERIAKAEALITVAGNINHVEKSMETNAKVMRNVPQWEEYIKVSKDALAKVDQSVFKSQYNSLLERAAEQHKAIGEVKENGKKIELLKKDSSKVEKLNYQYGVEVSGNKTTLSNSSIKGDLKITGNNNNVENVNIEGKLIIDPGKDGVVNVTGVKAKEILVLSGGENSLYIEDVLASYLEVISPSLTRVIIQGSSSIDKVNIASNCKFENYGTISSMAISPPPPLPPLAPPPPVPWYVSFSNYGVIHMIYINRPYIGDLPAVSPPLSIDFRDYSDKPAPLTIAAPIELTAGSSIINSAIVDSMIKDLSIKGNFNNILVNKIGGNALTLAGNIDNIRVNTNVNLTVSGGRIGTVSGSTGNNVKVEIGPGASVGNIIGGAVGPVPPTPPSPPPVNKVVKSITAPEAITGVVNGTAKTAAALGLPTKVAVVAGAGNVDANVEWNVSESSYDVDTKTKQTFDITGTVTLPSGVVNINGIELSTTINVTVDAALTDAEKVAKAKENLKLTGIDAVKSDLILPREQDDAEITWETSDEEVIDYDGTVYRPLIGSGDATVTLTATITVGNESDTKTFTVTVKEGPDKSDLEGAIDEADESASSIMLSEDGANVSTDSKWVIKDVLSTYESAIESAYQVLINVDATQEEVDTAISELGEAINAFNAAKQDGTVDWSELNAATMEMNTLIPSVTITPDGSQLSTTTKWVTPDDLNTYTAAVNAARQGLLEAGFYGTQEEVNEALSGVKAATEAFKAAMKYGQVIY